MVGGAGWKHQSARAWRRRARLSYMLSPTAASRIAAHVFARRCYGSLADCLEAAAAPSEGPEERDSEPRRWHAFVGRIVATTPSWSTLRGTTKIAWPSGVRRLLQPLVRKSVASDPRAVGHDGRKKAKATPLSHLDRAERCRNNLVHWMQALSHAASESSARRAGTRR